jgi:WD40 repeat protein
MRRFRRSRPVAPAVLAACCALAASALAYNAQPGLQLLWSRVADLHGEKGAVESAEFSPDGEHIVSGSKYDNRVVVWRVLDGSVVWQRVLDDEVERAGFSPDGQYVVSTGEDETLRLWRAADGEPLGTIPLTAAVDGMAFSPDGRLLVTGKEGGRVQAWAMPQMELRATAEHGDTVNSVTFTPDGRHVITASEDSTAKLWRLPELALVRTYELGQPEYLISARLSPDGQLLAAGAEKGFVAVWDFETGKRLARFNHTGRKVEAVAWTKDGRFLAVAGHDDHIRLVARSDFGAQYLPFVMQTEATGPAEYLDFSPNGGLLVSAHEDGTIRLWLYRAGDPDLNIRSHRELTRRQRAAAEKRQAERAAQGIPSK